MNFLLRTTHPVAPDLPTVPEIEHSKEEGHMSKRATTLEGLIAEDSFTNSGTSEDGDEDSDGNDAVHGEATGPTSKGRIFIGNHSDVMEDEGWITIPYKELSDGWSETSDILKLRSLDRSFVFPGEQLHILVCLSASKQEAEIITPFRVAEVMSRNGTSVQNGKQQISFLGNKLDSVDEKEDANGGDEQTGAQGLEENGRTPSPSQHMGPTQDINATESFIRMEDHKHQAETLLERFKNSNFFVRIAEADEPLWAKRNVAESSSVGMSDVRTHTNNGESRRTVRGNLINAVIDGGNFDGISSGGAARSTVRCYSLHNGDIVVVLQVNVAVGNMKDPVLEVLQFEKYQTSTSASEKQEGIFGEGDADPCRELLNWLLPLDRALPPRPLSPPVNPTFGSGAGHQRSSSSSGSQIFSFSHFRSYSMPSLPQGTGPSSSALSPSNNRPVLELEDYDRFAPEKLMKTNDLGGEGLLSFRGVSLEPERFSVHCGLEGIYLPGRRWRRKLEIVQPIEIHSFAAECTTDDLLCVQVKNVAPAHLPDIVLYLDAVTIVFEEASKAAPPLYLPIACIETGNGHSLPNLALRRGEEHSFILRPAAAVGRDFRSRGNPTYLPSHSKISAAASNTHLASRVIDGTRISSSADQFAILVSCRCNYTESKLFFKQSTNWRPRVSRDLMISVTLEAMEQTFLANGKAPQLPVQVLTLHASNLTSEDLTLTVCAPVSSSPPPSVVSLNSAPTSPMSPFIDFPEFVGRVGGDKRGTSMQKLSSMPAVRETQKESSSGGKKSISLGHRTVTTSDVISSTDLGCTHLCLQSTVPLGCVPARSSATVRLELLPLTDGIITLDTLQVAVKEKGLTYVPEQPLKIYATASIAKGII